MDNKRYFNTMSFIVWFFISPLSLIVDGKGFNFAYNKLTSQSSFERIGGFAHKAKHAVDGCYDRAEKNRRCCFVSSVDPHHWMAIDLMIPILMTQLVVYGYLCPRTEFVANCYESNPLWIRLSKEPVTPAVYNESFFTKHELTVYNDGIFDLRYDPPVETQYVALKQFEIYRNIKLTICEIEIFGLCLDYYFGHNCKRCNCATGPCDNITGTCPDIVCDPGWLGYQCARPCDEGQYGKNCLSTCPGCYAEKCHNVDGRCLKGCKRGLHGEYCTRACEAGYWHRNCKKVCGNCTVPCNIYNGTCPDTCQPGWNGTRCDNQCPAGTYGQKCINKCGHCMTGDCDPFSGKCKDGCKIGWRGSQCNAPCLPGRFGYKCELTCGHCESAVCDFITGNCPRMQMCDPGWSGNNCNATCDDNTFGKNCSDKCGACLNNEPCNVVNGYCDQGCEPGYAGDGCNIIRKDYLVLYILAALALILLLFSVIIFIQ